MAATTRIIAMVAGTGGGKTVFGPWWLFREIYDPDIGRGAGDYLAGSASFDLLQQKMLPEMMAVFAYALRVGRWWGANKVIELREPGGGFWARHSADRMWGRILLRSAHAGPNSFESATAKAAWIDEGGQDTYTAAVWEALERRLALEMGRLLITTTLYNLGYLVQNVLEPAQKGGVVTHLTSPRGEATRTINEPAGITLIQYDSLINPRYSEQEYRRIEGKMERGRFQLFYRGRTAKLPGMIIHNFNRETQIIPPFTIKPDWPRYVGLDFGGSNLIALFYAQDPLGENLYLFRTYHSGGNTIENYTKEILDGEPMPAACVGGSASENQWRLDFANAGLPILEPPITDVEIGIGRVLSFHGGRKIFVFSNQTEYLDEIGRYRRKLDDAGNPSDEILNKRTFHTRDAERYLLSWLFETQNAEDALIIERQEATALMLPIM